MRTISQLFLILTCVGWFGVCNTTAWGQEKVEYFEPAVNWNGLIDNLALRKELPRPNVNADKHVFTVILDKKLLVKLWEKWGLGGTVPTIDFDNYLVVVNTSTGCVMTVTRLSTTQVNNSMAMNIAQAIKKRGPPERGFSFSIAVFDRRRIRTIDGVVIPKIVAER